MVDDDDSCRESISLLLGVLGYDVQAYASVEALLGARPMLDTDCLLLDATTPGATGAELLNTVRTRSRELPLIFVTGYGTPEFKHELMAFGASDCLEKPLDEERLVGALKRAARAAEVS